MWKYIYDNYLDDYDYFVMGGTDYYVIVENLRAYLESEAIATANPKVPLYLGRRFAEEGDVERQFNSGGPSYILNKKALSLFVTNIEDKACRPNLRGSYEDVMIATCLKLMSNGEVLPYDTRDSEQRERFHPFTPGLMVDQPVGDANTLKQQDRKKQDWFVAYSSVWGLKGGRDTHSPYSISWHYTTPPVLKFMEALLYGCRAIDNSRTYKTDTESVDNPIRPRLTRRSDADMERLKELRNSIAARKEKVDEVTSRFKRFN